MQPIHLTTSEALMYAMVAQVIIGAVIGLIPLFLGRSRKQARMGLYGLLASTAAGLLSVLASIIIVAIFCWIIVKKNDGGASKSTVDDDPDQV